MDIQTVIAQRPLGLVFDIDGTLSPIAPTPAEARLHEDVAGLLEQARQHADVAIMTGRAIDDGAAMVNVNGLTYIGTHGLEWSEGLPELHGVQIVPDALQYVVPGAYLLDLAEQQLADIPGIIVQRKRTGGTIHYRLAAEPEQARQRILALLEEPARRLNMRLSEGKKVVEIKVPLAINKGQALRQFVQQHELRGVIFAGDDITDLDAMLEIPKLRQERVAALSIAVQHSDTFPDVLTYADITVQEVDGMVELLKDIVTLL